MHDVFQKGLVRGKERLPFDPEKEYFYVEHPSEGWRVYLRACCFIHETPEKEATVLDATRFVVVKQKGKPASSNVWEPPKGQMEGKDGLKHPSWDLERIMKENITREVAEESRIRTLTMIRYTGLYIEDRESDYKPNTFFQYHIFQAYVSPKEYKRASDELGWYRNHPEEFEKLSRDQKEKDRIAWYNPSKTKLMPRSSSKLVRLYIQFYKEEKKQMSK